MANLNSDALQPVSCWSEAVEKSKSYTDEALVTDLTNQFKRNLNKQITTKNLTYLTQREVHLLLGFYRVFYSQNNWGGEYSIGDFGGGNGYMYDLLQIYNPDCKISYCVYETEKISDSYSQLNQNPDIQFKNSQNFGKQNHDLVIISGTLQYISNWKEILNMARSVSKYVLVMRLPLIDTSEHKYYVQHFKEGIYVKSQASCPIILFSKNLMMKEIQTSYEIIFQSSDTQETIPFNGNQFPLITLLLKLK
jgi:putative methyltransferase (TIGR04325 family)